MTDHTTTPTPPEGLTDEQLDTLERQHWEATGVVSPSLQKEELFNYRAYGRAAIAADRDQLAQTERAVDPINLVKAGIRFGYMAGHNDTVEACYGDPDSVAEDYAAEVLSDIRPTPAPAPTPEEVEAQFCDWFQQEHGLALAGICVRRITPPQEN